MNNQFFGQALQGLGQGLMAAGGGGWNQFAPAFSQGLMNAQNMQFDRMDREERRKLRELQEEQLRLQLEQQRTANQDALREKQEWQSLFVPGAMSPPTGASVGGMRAPGMMPGTGGTAPPLITGLMQGADPAQIEILKRLGPGAGKAILAEKAFADAPGAPDTTGGMYWDQDARQFKPIPGYEEQQAAIRAAGRAPASAPKRNIITLYDPAGKPKSLYDDDPSVSGMLEQGWTEAAPKSGSVLAQVGTDAQGNPIYDYVAAAPKLTEDQSKAMNFASRMEASAPIIDQFEQQGTDLGARARSAIPFGLGNYGQSEEYQQYSQAKEDFMRAVLRKESGAVISDEEMVGGDRQYFPQPGDSPEVILQKRQNRRVALEAMKSAAGPGAQLIPGIVERSTGTPQDPMTLNDKYGTP